MLQTTANEYALRIGPKTRFLNCFRRVFQLPFLERFLVRQVKHSRNPVWRKLVPPDYLYKKGSIRRTDSEDLRFELDISNVVEHLVYFHLTPENFSPVKEAVRTARVIFDVGANIGGTSLFFASNNQHASIYSFEPQVETFEKARRNIGLNTFNNIHLLNMGLGAVKESKKLYRVIENNPAMNRIMPGDLSYPFTLVQISTLDEFCYEQGIEQVDFLKIDVEGYEYFVLVGGTKIITASHPVIYLEL